MKNIKINFTNRQDYLEGNILDFKDKLSGLNVIIKTPVKEYKLIEDKDRDYELLNINESEFPILGSLYVNNVLQSNFINIWFSNLKYLPTLAPKKTG